MEVSWVGSDRFSLLSPGDGGLCLTFGEPVLSFSGEDTRRGSEVGGDFSLCLAREDAVSREASLSLLALLENLTSEWRPERLLSAC